MWSKQQLILDRLPPVFDARLQQLQQDIISGKALDVDPDPYTRFRCDAMSYFTASRRYQLQGIDQFGYQDIIIGCNHFIDNLVMKHGVEGLQIFEHDYKYYQRMCPGISFARVGKLVLGKPVLIAAPIPGYLDLHPQWSEIVKECEIKNIPMHLDASWMGAATDIDLDLRSRAIRSVCMSLSKGQGMHWNRVGLRWSRDHDETDSISIYNQFRMIPECLVRNGIVAMSQVEPDYLWNTYGDQHRAICRVLKLRPSKIIHAARSLDRTQLYGLANFFNAEYGSGHPLGLISQESQVRILPLQPIW